VHKAFNSYNREKYCFQTSSVHKPIIKKEGAKQMRDGPSVLFPQVSVKLMLGGWRRKK
jgi:hypothetical protein